MSDVAARTPERSRRIGFAFYALHLWTIWGIAVSNAFLGLAGLSLALGRPWQGLAWRRRGALLGWLAALAVLFGISLVFSYEPGRSLAELPRVLTLAPAALTLVYVRGEKEARRVSAGLVTVGALLALFGLAQVWSGQNGIDLAERIPGPFSHYQTFAGVLLVCDLVGLAALMAGPRRSRLLWAGALVLINLALLANLTRGSWVALAVALVFLVALREPRWLLGVVPAVLLMAMLLPGPLSERIGSIFDLRDASNYDRLCMLDAGVRMVAERPLYGLGPGVVESRYPLYRHPTAPHDRRPHLHNSYLQIAAENGLLALAAYVGMLFASLRVGLRNYRREGGSAGPRADLHLGACAALVAYTLAGLFEDNWGDTEVQRVALFVIALPFCLDLPREDS